MNQKLTRRAVLGIAVTGLVAGPFAIRYFRKPNMVMPLGDYDRFEVCFERVTTDLPKEELKKGNYIF